MPTITMNESEYKKLKEDFRYDSDIYIKIEELIALVKTKKEKHQKLFGFCNSSERCRAIDLLQHTLYIMLNETEEQEQKNGEWILIPEDYNLYTMEKIPAHWQRPSEKNAHVTIYLNNETDKGIKND